MLALLAKLLLALTTLLHLHTAPVKPLRGGAVAPVSTSTNPYTDKGTYYETSTIAVSCDPTAIDSTANLSLGACQSVAGTVLDVQTQKDGSTILVLDVDTGFDKTSALGGNPNQKFIAVIINLPVPNIGDSIRLNGYFAYDLDKGYYELTGINKIWPQ